MANGTTVKQLIDNLGRISNEDTRKMATAGLSSLLSLFIAAEPDNKSSVAFDDKPTSQFKEDSVAPELPGKKSRDLAGHVIDTGNATSAADTASLSPANPFSEPEVDAVSDTESAIATTESTVIITGNEFRAPNIASSPDVFAQTVEEFELPVDTPAESVADVKDAIEVSIPATTMIKDTTSTTPAKPVLVASETDLSPPSSIVGTPPNFVQLPKSPAPDYKLAAASKFEEDTEVKEADSRGSIMLQPSKFRRVNGRWPHSDTELIDFAFQDTERLTPVRISAIDNGSPTPRRGRSN